jgi:MoaA/NifB/PqqE/SkfB family radical SAM enzyme
MITTVDNFHKLLLKFLNRGQPPHDYESQIIRNPNLKRRLEAIFSGRVIPPYEVEIQPTSCCNLRCKHCFGTSLTCNKLENKIRKEEIKEIAEKIDEYKEGEFQIEIVKFCGTTGEPLLNPITPYAIELFKKLNKKITLFTNGVLLDKELNGKKYLDYVLKADKLILSLDAASKETFYRLKRRDFFNKVVRNLEELIEKRNLTESNLNIAVSYVISEENYEEILEATDLVKNLGADEIRFRVDFAHPDKVQKISDKIIKALDQTQKYKTDNFQVSEIYSEEEISGDCRAFNSWGRKCFNQYFWACIGPDGNLYACGHRTYFGVESYGSLLNESFKEIWTGKKRSETLSKLPDKRCIYCSPSSARRNTFLTFLETAIKQSKGNGKMINLNNL